MITELGVEVDKYLLERNNKPNPLTHYQREAAHEAFIAGFLSGQASKKMEIIRAINGDNSFKIRRCCCDDQEMDF